MTEVDVPELLTHFSDLPDPRKARGIRHELTDIVVMSILAVICEANTPCGVQVYSQIYQYAVALEVINPAAVVTTDGLLER